LILEQNSLKTIASVTKMKQQNRNKHIYMRARTWRPHKPSQPAILLLPRRHN
jgi:hypothetical protein